MKTLILICLIFATNGLSANCDLSSNAVEKKLPEEKDYQGLEIQLFLTSIETEKRWAFNSDGWEAMWIEKLVQAGEMSRSMADQNLDLSSNERNRIFNELEKLRNKHEEAHLYYVIGTTADGVERKRGYMFFWEAPNGDMDRSKLVF